MTVRRPYINVICQGDGRQMGLAQGTALRELIQGTVGVLREFDGFRLRQPGWMPYRLFRRLAAVKARALLAGPLRRQLPFLQQRLQGMAQGAGVDENLLYLIQAVEAAVCSLGDLTRPPSFGACSTVVVRGSRSASGEPILAKNFDYLPLVQPFYTLIRNRPAQGHGSLAFTVAALCGTVDGINDQGLAIAYNYAFATDTGSPGPTLSMVIAESLRRHASVGEAAAWIASQSHLGGGLLMLADATGDIASLELSNTRSCLRRPEPHVDWLAHTNLYASDQLREVQVRDNAVYSEKAPRPLRGTPVLTPFVCHQRRLDQLMQEAKRLGGAELAVLMADHGEEGVPSADTVCVHSDYWATTASLQLYPRSGRMRVAYDSACRASYEDFELS